MLKITILSLALILGPPTFAQTAPVEYRLQPDSRVIIPAGQNALVKCLDRESAPMPACRVIHAQIGFRIEVNGYDMKLKPGTIGEALAVQRDLHRIGFCKPGQPDIVPPVPLRPVEPGRFALQPAQELRVSADHDLQISCRAYQVPACAVRQWHTIPQLRVNELGGEVLYYDSFETGYAALELYRDIGVCRR